MLTTARSLDDTRPMPGPGRASRDTLSIVFYVGIPLCMAVIMAWNPTGSRAPRMPGPFLPALYWLGVLLPAWLLLDLSARALRWASDRIGLRLPLILLLIGGALLATLLMRPYLIYYWAAVDHLLDPATARPLGELSPPWPKAVAEFVQTVRRAGILISLWMVANLFYVHVLGIARYGYGKTADRDGERDRAGTDEDLGQVMPAPDGAPAPRAVPTFVERLSGELGHDVISLQAQDHYLRVTTPRGSALILYRFSDALKELDASSGIRAHRSYWVARSAVTRLVARGGRHFLLLANGDRVPVSRTYLEQVRQRLN